MLGRLSSLAVIFYAALVAGYSAAAEPPKEPAAPPEPTLYLSWHAPYGTPRATDTLEFACGSMTRLDTLFMSFDPGQSSGSFTGFTAALWVRPIAEDDTLSAIWDAPSASALPLWMRIEFDPDSTTGCASPFLVPGAGGAACHHVPGGGRMIRMVHAVAFADSVSIEAGKRYGLARFIIRQPARSPGCLQPICITWMSSVLSTIGGRHRPVEPKGVSVTLNAHPGQTCPAPPGPTPAPATAPGAAPKGQKTP